jgi:hypothetical protein
MQLVCRVGGMRHQAGFVNIGRGWHHGQYLAIMRTRFVHLGT